MEKEKKDLEELIKFEDLNLSSELNKAINELGFKNATLIQRQAIPVILKGHDVIGHSQTGTGKTAAFGIPAIENLDTEKLGNVQVLVLCPTRELAVQSSQEMRKFAKYKKIKIHPIYGGQSIDFQIKALKSGCDIVIGTPGRIIDHLNRKTLKLNNLKTIVLDEADEMLNMGFVDDIETILKAMPEKRQTLLFSATMSKEILSITKKYLTDPIMVKIAKETATASTIKQYMYDIPKGAKIEVLARLIDYYNPKRSMIFCNTKKMVDTLSEELRHRGYFAEGLHGDMKQFSRNQAMESFKRGRIDLLIATDVAARGLDVDNVQYVINFDLPQDLEYYVHRIGRTGRIGREGTSLTLISGNKEFADIKNIERQTKSKIELKPIPTMTEVADAKNDRIADNILNTIEKGLLNKHISIVEKLAEKGIEQTSISAALLKMLYSNDTDNDIFEDTIKKEESKIKLLREKAKNGIFGALKRTKPASYNKNNRDQMVKLMLNIGKNDRINPGNIVGAIAGETGLNGRKIGSIDIYDSYSFVEVPNSYSDVVLSVLNGSKMKGKRVKIEKVRVR